MPSEKDFEIGDLVWAKMKGFPFWPAKIVKPPADAKTSSLKKGQHYVYFFGSENYAFITHDNIQHHSEDKLKAVSKKKSATLKLAIDQICEEAREPKSPVKEMDSAKNSPEASTSSTERKSIKVSKPKGRTENLKVHKKIAPKSHSVVEPAKKQMSPPRKLAKKSENYSTLNSNTPPSIRYNRVAVIRPLDDRVNAVGSGITKREHFALPPAPAFNVLEMNEAMKARAIVPTDKKIGFIGLGMMGSRLVKNLIITGHDVTIWNRTPEKCNEFVKAGAKAVQTPSDVVEKCDITFCCVSGPEASKMLVFGNCGILAGLKDCIPGSKGFVEMTTIDPTTSREIAEAIEQRGGRYLEAPLTGSRETAENGALIILAAGDLELFKSCESCLDALSYNLNYYLTSDVGQGSKLTAIFSMLNGIQHAALAEAMALLESSQLSSDTFLEVLQLSSMCSPLLVDKTKAMKNRSFAPNNSLKYQQKGLRLALAMSNTCEQPMLVTAAANELYKHANVLRYGDHDVSAIYLAAKY